ncbi:MAG TPA: prepilin-type N-terminal cleavage/methylation domain-containing protein [Gemmatimonadaceae bacterium]|nr:prepilin-type N-terminal cleavage/methylation domain-containing protein [Gemmatimonadaceae bacterium]
MTRRALRCRRGTTLIELLVTISILAIISGIATMAIRRIDRPNPADPQQILADSMRKVLATGQALRIHLSIDGRPVNAAIAADGSIVADSAFGIERFTGAPINAR